MKQIVQNPGGRWYFGEDFMNPQEEILFGIIEPFLAELGQFVFCGCKLSNNTISQGVVVLNSKACKFEGSAEGISTPYYVKYATRQDNVQYKTGVDVGYITYFAEPCQPTDTGAFRLDNAPRFADVFKPKTAAIADNATNAANANYANNANNATNAGNADTLDGKHAYEFINRLTANQFSVRWNGSVLVFNVDGADDRPVHSAYNADMVDGKHASYFPQTIEVEDWDNVEYKAGDILLGSPTSLNSPSNNYLTAITLTINNDLAYTRLLGIDMAGTVWKRSQHNGVWQPWINAADGGNAATLADAYGNRNSREFMWNLGSSLIQGRWDKSGRIIFTVDETDDLPVSRAEDANTLGNKQPTAYLQTERIFIGSAPSSPRDGDILIVS